VPSCVPFTSTDPLTTITTARSDAGDIPVGGAGSGAEVRVVVGSSHGMTSPITGLLTPISLIDVDVRSGSSAVFDVPASDRAVVMVVSGSVEVNGTQLGTHHVATLDPGIGDVRVTGGPDGGVALVLWATPIGEPVVFGGPFAMTNQADITDAQRRFRAGDMGRLAPSF
jgi:redox-sensitive bicupin YhaK (pirin superfamily)